MINKDELKKQVKAVIEYSQSLSNVNTDLLIEKWLEAKRDFIEAFDGELIYKTKEPVTFELDRDQQISKLQKFIDMINSNYNYPELIDFIDYYQNDFFDNKMSSSYNRHGFNIASGMKLTKAYKEFVNNEYDLDRIQTAASRLIQENKITGYLCLSVHPLDYLSSSENNNNWRSCHALDGEYRAGNLSYMLDSSTIVCYICNDRKEKLPRFPESIPWNSKKWRMLLFVSDNWNAVFAGRHYPFFSENIMEVVRERWAEKATPGIERAIWGASNAWSHWHDDYFQQIQLKKWSSLDDFSTNDRYVPIRDKIYSMRALVKDQSKLHFNDLLESNFYIPYYCWNKISPAPIKFHIGAQVPCLICGDNYLTDTDSMVCSQCLEPNGFIHCADCGEIVPEDMVYWTGRAEDHPICIDCYSHYYDRCINCNMIYHVDDLIWDEERDRYYCEDCYREKNML